MYYRKTRKYFLLSCAIMTWMGVFHTNAADNTVHVIANRAKEAAKFESQQTTVITQKEIEEKQAKTVEDLVFHETGVSRTVDSMGRVGVSIRGAEPRHTLILVDGQPAIGDFAKYLGAGDELMRIGTENLDRVEIVQGAASAKYGADAIGGVINVVTKKPLKKAGLQFNVESLRLAGDHGLMPHSNFFMRADTGRMGKVSMALYGSKKDVLPVYASKLRKTTGMDHEDMTVFEQNALRFWGESSNAGVSTNVKLNNKNSIDFRMDRYMDDLHRFTKHSNSINEPGMNFKRTVKRNTYNLTWHGKDGKKTQWDAEVNYARVRESDVTLQTYDGKSIFEGNNILTYVDDVDHKQYDVHATINVAANDQHYITYGFGMKEERGEGSRLKSAPDTYRIKINPWDYDKDLMVDNKTGEVKSFVHDYEFTQDKDGVPHWNFNNEWYAYDAHNPSSVKPQFTYEEFLTKTGGMNVSMLDLQRALSGDTLANAKALGEKLLQENPEIAQTLPYGDRTLSQLSMVIQYYMKEKAQNGKFVTLNGKAFKENQKERDNEVTLGRATIKKQHVFVSDNWQVNDDTIITPILRLDHSSLFGSTMTFNMGMTHNVHHNPHHRFKINVGTGYAEPGMGELYYNWEMFPSNPVFGFFGGGTARLGWYFMGNPNLQPEKSLNMDMSLEGEKGKTSYRATLFHNRITDYLTVYFTGKLWDTHPEMNESNFFGSAKFAYAPDMIYSFKNIGKAEITGFETEINHQLGKHWSAKLGYTFLQAENKSDPTMPKQLLDKPKHKIDIGINYENTNTGWSGSLYGNYYINMLDSNSVAGNGNYMDSELNPGGDIERGTGTSTITYHFAKAGAQHYERKTFGTWNIIVQKQLGKDAKVYAAVDNIFNHRDDDRAMQGRVFRFGANFKIGADGHIHETIRDAQGKVIASIDRGPVGLENFLRTPYEAISVDSTKVIGDYTAQWDWHDGSNRSKVRATAMTSVGNADKNMLDASEHGFKQRIHLGLKGKITDNAKFKVVASASSNPGVETQIDVSHTKGLNHTRLEEAEITQKNHNWNYSIGRLHEKIGVTGYWFDQAFDGARVVYTNKHTQVRFGVGDFSKSTGVEDSAYTRTKYSAFDRSPTVLEFLGIDRSDSLHPVITEPDKTKSIGFYKQLLDASGKPQEQLDAMKRMISIINKAYPEYLKSKNITLDTPKEEYIATYDDDSTYEGSVNGLWGMNNFDTKYRPKLSTTMDNPSLLETGEANFAHTVDKSLITGGYDDASNNDAAEHMSDPYGEVDSIEWTTGSLDNIYKDFLELNNPLTHSVKFATKSSTEDYMVPTVVNSIWDTIGSEYSGLITTENSNRLPREALGRATGVTLQSAGAVLEKDSVPAIHKAFYVQANHEFTPKLGVSAWYLRSFGNHQEHYSRLSENGNEDSTFSKVAHIIGLGATYQLGHHVSLSVDVGRNLSSLGKYFNGSTEYRYNPGNSTYTIVGHRNGSDPLFWNARLDIGRADYAVKGSWSAFIDYKSYEHGSFFGGNGTDALPDRYLDGIRSFTLGGAYILAKDFMVQAFYTFGAEGTGKRDTLFGPENFKLGNYSRIQMTYKF